MDGTEVMEFSLNPGMIQLTKPGAAVGIGVAIAHAIWAHGNSHPMHPSNAMATGPRRNQIAIITAPASIRLLMTSPL